MKAFTTLEKCELRQNLLAGNWPAVEVAVMVAREQWQSAPSHETFLTLSHLLIGLTEHQSEFVLEALTRWSQQAPLTGTVWLLLGLTHTKLAAMERGTGSANRVSAQSWKQIAYHYAQAEKAFERALSDGVLPKGAIRSAQMRREQVQGQKEAVADGLFRAFLQEDPQWLAGWKTRMAQLEPRWGGSWPEVEALLELADKTLEDAVSRQDLHLSAIWWRANYAYYFEQDADRALQIAETGLQHEGPAQALANLWELKADIALSQSQLEPAWAAYQKAIALTPEAADLRFNFGNALHRAELCDAAKAQWEVGATLHGNEAHECAYWLGHYLSFGTEGFPADTARADNLLKQAVEKAGSRKQRAWGYFAQGRLYTAPPQQDWIKARACFQAAAEDGLTHAWRFWSRALEEHPEAIPDTALEITQAYQKGAEAGDTRSRIAYARRLEEGLGCAVDAEQAQTQWALAADAGNYEALLHCAASATRQGDFAQAQALLWQASACADAEETEAANLLVYGGLVGKYAPLADETANELLLHVRQRTSQVCGFSDLLHIAVLFRQLHKDRSEIKALRSWLKKLSRNQNLEKPIREHARVMLRATPAGWMHRFYLKRPKTLPLPPLPQGAYYAAFSI